MALVKCIAIKYTVCNCRLPVSRQLLHTSTSYLHSHACWSVHAVAMGNHPQGGKTNNVVCFFSRLYSHSFSCVFWWLPSRPEIIYSRILFSLFQPIIQETVSNYSTFTLKFFCREYKKAVTVVNWSLKKGLAIVALQHQLAYSWLIVSRKHYQ